MVVLAASACESARILLNSKSAQFPHGLANSSGKVGRYLMDTVGCSVGGQIPLLENLPPLNEDAADGMQLYVPWWLYREQLAGKLGFARGYHIEFGGGKRMPGHGTGAGLEWLTGGSYGAKFKQDVRRYYGSFVWFDGRGEMIPNEQSYCEIDPQRQGQVGHPGAALSLAMVGARAAAGRAHAKHLRRHHRGHGRAHASSRSQTDGAKAIAPGGSIIHEVGGAIMGADRTNFGHQLLGPDLGRGESVHDGRRGVRLQRGQESDAHHHGAWRGAPPTISSSACGARSCDGSAHHHQVGAGRERRVAAAAATRCTRLLRRRARRVTAPIPTSP